jgi:predicted translin family RNA/ssDNA-binding protein
MMSIQDDQLKTVSKLAEYQLILENKIKSAEEDLATLKEQYKQVSQTDLPEALAETGLSEIKLTDGSKISVQQFYNASIPKDNIDEAFTWLRNNGHADLIKNTVACNFGRGEDAEARALKDTLNSIGLSFTEKVGVHPQTLKAFVREQVESGQNLPLDLLGVYIGQKTVIKGG